MQTIEEKLMQKALHLAKRASSLGEVPVGCVIELNGEIIGSGFNKTISLKDPTAHAEIIAIRQAGKRLGDFRLENTRIFVTVEPCIMCLGAILLARISELHFGVTEPKLGAFTIFNLNSHSRFRKLKIFSGHFPKEIKALMANFFQELRAKENE